MNESLVFDIQRFCLHDGPGIRTIVFFKGCPLSCRWCCNPESQAFHAELMRHNARCLGCGLCMANCPSEALRPSDPWPAGEAPDIDRARCQVCGRCAAVCPTRALAISGRSRPLGEIVAEVLRDRSFFDVSGGGVTLSGGEPLAHPAAVEALLAEFQSRNIHTAVETSGHAPWPDLERIAPLVDVFLYDLKHADDQQHRAWTGVGNARILDNLTRLSRLHHRLIVRVPLIPGFNTDPASLRSIAQVVRPLRIAHVQLLPFHRLGQGKYHALGRRYRCAAIEPPTHDELARLNQQFQSLSETM